MLVPLACTWESTRLSEWRGQGEGGGGGARRWSCCLLHPWPACRSEGHGTGKCECAAAQVEGAGRREPSGWGGEAVVQPMDGEKRKPAPQLACKREGRQKGGERRKERGRGREREREKVNGEGVSVCRERWPTEGVASCVPSLQTEGCGLRGGNEGKKWGNGEANTSGYEWLALVPCTSNCATFSHLFPSSTFLSFPFPCATPTLPLAHRRASSPPPSSLCLPHLTLPACKLRASTASFASHHLPTGFCMHAGGPNSPSPCLPPLHVLARACHTIRTSFFFSFSF
jgi:hypothetical protein